MPDGAAPSPSPLAAPAPTEIIAVDDPITACDGGDGPLGHPRVWLRCVPPDNRQGAQPQIMCPYCSRLYVLNAGAGTDHGH